MYSKPDKQSSSTNNNKVDFISEKIIEDISLQNYMNNIKHLQEKENYLENMPYNDEYPRIFYYKTNNCHSGITKAFYLSCLMSFVSLGFFTGWYYNNSVSPLRIWKVFPLNASIWGIFFMGNVLLSPPCQTINRGEFSPSNLEEEIFKHLVEKCDIYDHIDSLLELREKYSLYEMEQVKKELIDKKKEIAIQNFEKFREIRRGEAKF